MRSVCSTRLRYAVDLSGDDRLRDGLAEVELLHGVGNRGVRRQEEPCAHRDAVGPVGERGKPARGPRRRPPAAITGIAPCTTSTTCGSSRLVGTDPV